MNYKEKLQKIDDQKWPEPVKTRARELLKANYNYRLNKAKLDGMELYSKTSPAILLESGRLLQRLGECYKALAAEVAFYITTDH